MLRSNQAAANPLWFYNFQINIALPCKNSTGTLSLCFQMKWNIRLPSDDGCNYFGCTCGLFLKFGRRVPEGVWLVSWGWQGWTFYVLAESRPWQDLQQNCKVPYTNESFWIQLWHFQITVQLQNKLAGAYELQTDWGSTSPPVCWLLCMAFNLEKYQIAKNEPVTLPNAAIPTLFMVRGIHRFSTSLVDPHRSAASCQKD